MPRACQPRLLGPIRTQHQRAQALVTITAHLLCRVSRSVQSLHYRPSLRPARFLFQVKVRRALLRTQAYRAPVPKARPQVKGALLIPRRAPSPIVHPLYPLRQLSRTLPSLTHPRTILCSRRALALHQQVFHSRALWRQVIPLCPAQRICACPSRLLWFHTNASFTPSARAAPHLPYFLHQ